jgi:hypothetical protein
MMPRRQKVPENARDPTTSEAPPVHVSVAPQQHARRMPMQSPDRPYFTYQHLLFERLGDTKAVKARGMYVNYKEWLYIKEAIGKSRQITQNGHGSLSLEYDGITITYIPDQQEPSGIMDFRDPDNPVLIRE